MLSVQAFDFQGFFTYILYPLSEIFNLGCRMKGDVRG